MIFNTCDHCAVAIENGDLSGLESFYGIEDMARIEAALEAIGWVTMTETVDRCHYFTCYVCDETCLVEMFIFEPA